MISNWLLYIDPGSGSYLIQVIIAAALGVAFWIKTSWWRIKMFLTKNKKDVNNDSLTEEDT